MEIASTINEIFPSHRTAIIQSFAAEMKIATIMEFQPCMTIVAKILKKRTIKGGKDQ